MLIEHPIVIERTLENYGFANIENRGTEIRCGHDSLRNRTSIRICLTNNPYLYVNDFSDSYSGEFFSFIIKSKGVDFRSVISFVKQELNIDDYGISQRSSIFDGAFDKLTRRRSTTAPPKIYSPDILDIYPKIFSKRFLNDRIPISAQTEFDIRFDPDSARIVIPIYSSSGELIGVKGRADWDVQEDEPKYLYLVPCRCSETLYGFAHNYSHMVNSTIYVCESEKAVMQAWGYGYFGFVGLGGNHVSDRQCKLMVELLPKQIVLLPDVGLDVAITDLNVRKLQSYTRLLDIQIGYWDWSKHNDPDKASPTDLGVERLKHIIGQEIEWSD